MRKSISLIRGLLLASALMLAPSCADRARDVNHLPPPSEALKADQKASARPELPEGAITEKAYDEWDSDVHDWGDFRNQVAYRWCTLWNSFATQQVDCGDNPEPEILR